MAQSPNAQVEELRHAAREVLASRPGASLNLLGIRRRIEKDKLVDFQFTDEQLRGALQLLIDLDQVIASRDNLGSTEYFRATATGILAFERGA